MWDLLQEAEDPTGLSSKLDVDLQKLLEGLNLGSLGKALPREADTRGKKEVDEVHESCMRLFTRHCCGCRSPLLPK